MKLYSWNMLYSNAEQDRAFEFIRGLTFDAMCLQEVPEEFLARLKTLPFHLAAGIETDWLGDTNNIIRNYCVILSPHNILSSHDFAFPKLFWPRRTSLFLRVMSRWGWRRVKNRRSLYADVEMPGIRRMRVFCLHLTLSYPKRLLLEFELAASLRDPSYPSIFCGDFNIIESLRVTALNWLLGGSFTDIFGSRSSRTNAEKRFAELSLQNPLRGTVTQMPSYSQLDHILVPNTFRVNKAEVLEDAMGSDHHPVYLDCSPA